MLQVPQSGSMEDALDKRPITPFQIRLLVLCGITFWFEGYDFQVMALAIPALAAQWGMPAAEFKWVLSSVYIGLGIGALVLAPIGDRVGHRVIVIASTLTLLFSLLASGFADNLHTLFLSRLVTGMSLGTIIPNVSALINGYMPPRIRSLALTWLTCSYSVGAMMASFVASPLIRSYGWEAAFFFSAASTAVILTALWIGLPETLRFLNTSASGKGRAARILNDLGIRPDAVMDARHIAAQPGNRVTPLHLLKPPYRLPTLLWWAIFSTNGATFAVLVSWLPTIVAGSGLGWLGVMSSTAMMWSGGILGSLTLARLIDRTGLRIWPLLGCLLSTMISFILFAVAPPVEWAWLPMLFLIGIGVGSLTFLQSPLGALFYPSRLLATGLGTGIAVPRVAGILAPVAAGSLIATGMPPTLLMSTLALPVGVTAILLAAFAKLDLDGIRKHEVPEGA